MKVGIIGAGTMGSGIAQAFAQTEGYEVYLCDINDATSMRHLQRTERRKLPLDSRRESQKAK